MQVELQSTCAALGYHEGDEYHKEPDCLETVKDLIRFLKHEDDTCEIRRQLGSAQIVQNDLVPLVKYYSDDNTLLDVVIRLLVNLTQPAVLCFQNHIPEDKTNRNYFLEIESHLQSYKEVFVDEAFFAIITKKLGDLLKLDWEHRQEEDRLLIERILVLIRNILHIPPNPVKEKRTDDDASIHDQVLWSLHISGVEDLLLYLASSEDETQFCLHVLEIISLMFREQTAEQLASSGVSRSASEKEQDERELELMRERERAQKRANMLKYSTRHSCFGGTYTVNNMKSISDRDVIFHRRLGNIKDITFDHNKPKKKKPKNRAPITTVELTRRSTLSIRVFLREFCVQLLENCYNPLMYAVKDILVRSKAQENDETYYLWAMRFFMEFNRRYNFRIDLVSETMSVQAFHTIHMNLQTFHEMVLTNKKEGVIWSRRLHLALNAYHELLETMSAMEKTKDPRLRDSANVMKSNVFYMLEYRDIFLMLLKNFDETKQSRTYLKDLVEATHLFVKMLESYSKCRSHLVVQRKKRNAGHRKKKQKASRHTNGTTQPSEEELEELWDNVSSELSAIFQGRGEIPQEVTPFDAASEIDVDLQRGETKTVLQAGDKTKTVLQAGDKTKTVLQAGDKTKTVLQAGDKTKTVLQAGDKTKTVLQAGDKTKPLLQAGDKTKTVLQAGDKTKTVLQAGDKTKTVLQAGDKTKTVLQAGDKTKTVLQAGDKTKPLLQAGDKTKALLQAGDKTKTLLQAGDKTKTVLQAGDKTKPLLQAGDKTKTLLQAGDKTKTVLQAGDKTKPLLQAGDKTKTLLQAGDRTKPLLQAGDKTKTLLQVGDKTKTLLQAGDKTKTLLQVGDKTKTLLQAGDNAETLLQAGDKTKTLLQVGDKTKTLLQAGDKTKTLLQVGDKTKTLLQVRDKTKILLQVSDKTKTLLQVRDKTKTLGQAGDKTKTLLQAGDKTKTRQKHYCRVNAMRQIQDGLRSNRPGEAVALLRAAREVWPEREEFGSADISPEEEFMALREICYANIPRLAVNTDTVNSSLVSSTKEADSLKVKP
ncbi:hypothetical protein LSAT2_024533 [Lamellibrachia satsuma]|nr:hypothetical protein LSAT2_024533 [Lamellibrachia satsuma]